MANNNGKTNGSNKPRPERLVVYKEPELKPIQQLRKLGGELEVAVRQWLRIAELLGWKDTGVFYIEENRKSDIHAKAKWISFTITWEENGPYADWHVQVYEDGQPIEDVMTALSWLGTALGVIKDYRKESAKEIAGLFGEYKQAMAAVEENQ